MTSCKSSRKSTSSSTPRFIENLGDVIVREGEIGSLECQVGGFPRPEIQWELNGRMIPKSRNIHLERMGDRCVLRIKSCQSKDEGDYICIARNIMGTATSRGTLSVLSGLKDGSTLQSNGTLFIATRKKEIGVEKKCVSPVKNSRFNTNLKMPLSTSYKPTQSDRKSEDAKIEKNSKTEVKSKNVTSNILSTYPKTNRTLPGDLTNVTRDKSPKSISKTSVNKTNQNVALHNPLKTQTLRINLSTKSKPPSKPKNTSVFARDRCIVSAKGDGHSSMVKKSLTVKRGQTVSDAGVGKKVIAKEEMSKERKTAGRKEVPKNWPILKDNISVKILNKQNETYSKTADRQKSGILPNERRRTVKLIRQGKFEETDSFEKKSEFRRGTPLSSSSHEKRHCNVTKVSKPSYIRDNEVISKRLTVFSNVTNGTCEKSNKQSNANLKVNLDKKRKLENNSDRNKIRSDFKSSQNFSVRKGVKSPIPSSDSGFKRKNGKTPGKKLIDQSWKTDSCPGMLNEANNRVSVKKSSCNSSSRIEFCLTTKPQSDNVNKIEISDPRVNDMPEINYMCSSKLRDASDPSDNSANSSDLKDSCFLDSSAGSVCVPLKRDSIRSVEKLERDTNDQHKSVQNETEQNSDIKKDHYVRHKVQVSDLVVVPDKKDTKAELRCKDISQKACEPASGNTVSPLILSTPQNGTDRSKCNGLEYNIIHTAVYRSSSLPQNEELLHNHDLSAGAQTNSLPNQRIKISTNVPETKKLRGSEMSRIYDKTSDTKAYETNIPSEVSLNYSEPESCNECFGEEKGSEDKAVERLNKELRENEEKETHANIYPVVTSFLNSFAEKAKTQHENCKAADEHSKKDIVNNVDHAKPPGWKKRDFFDTRTCKGNVRLNSDVIEEECEVFIPRIPEAEAEEDTQQVESQEEFPVRIVKGPQSVTVLRGESVTLAVHFQGTPPPTVTWARGGTTLRSDGRVSILAGRDMSVLTVSDVTADDSGKYVVSVENTGGGDSCFASMAVVGIPEPPGGQPTASDVTDHSLVLSWYGSMYDGGSVVTGYVVEMSTLPERRWHKVSSCVNTSHVIQGLSNGQHYVFRVRAENRYGLSQPSRESEAICLEDSSSEDWETPRNHVKIEAGSLFSEQFELKEEVGKGRFGTVYRCIERTSGRPRAAKIIRCIKAKDKEKVQQEISVMNKLNHPKLMQILAAFESGKNMIMIMEFISGGELFERVIADDFVLTEHDCVLFMRQICDGVAHMHKCSVLHLDLKPENILCKTRTCHQIKIIDFGLARVFNPDENLRVLFGTPEFVAPEVINYEPVGPPSDMWSVGVVCYVLLSGLSPFMGESDPETFANITRGEMDFDDEAFDTISEDAKNFISFLLVKKQKDRMTAEKCLKHCWLSSAGWNASDVPLSTEKLKRFIVRRKWQKTGTAIRALGRMVSLSRSSFGSSSGTPSPLGSPKIFQSQSAISRSETSESGFSEVFSDSNSVSELVT